MAQITKELFLDVARKNLFRAIVAKQNDIGSRFLKVTLLSEGAKIPVEADAAVILNVTREDGAAAGFSGSVNPDGTVTVPLSGWTLARDGIVRCSISVISAQGGKLTSASFSLNVEAAEYFCGDMLEDESCDILIRLIAECAGAKTACEAAAADARDAAEKALDAAEKALAASPGFSVATDEETKEMLDGVFSESAIATDEEVMEALREVFD